MVERARMSFTDDSELSFFEEALRNAGNERTYQAAMQFMIECRGQSGLNAFIRDAVIESRSPGAKANMTEEDLERDLDGWHLRPGVAALGQLIRENDQVFQRPILTSNFDPLIEVAIRRAGRGAITINLPSDGSFRGLIVNDNTAQVVHFHGFWRQGDTLHTPDQLTRERPLLAANLRKLLQETVLVVLGYGGWNDVFTESLMKAIGEQSEVIDVLWTFFAKNPDDIRLRHQTLLERFHSLPGQRVVVYGGVDCHDFLPRLRERLTQSKAIRIEVNSVLESNLVNVEVRQVSSPTLPPTTFAWVGRESELKTLLTSEHSVISLHGMGGFGKSSLAAHMLNEKRSSHNMAFSYWSDCKEQGNTVQTHLVNMLELITQGKITAASLQKSSAQDVIELFFQSLGQHRGLIVFDNIDHYVDLETESAVGTINALLEKALTVNHAAQFVFTSRPKLRYSSEKFLSLHVPGLSREDADTLFHLRGALWDPVRKEEQLDAVQRVTQGGALHLNLIATQVAKQRTTLDDLLRRIDQGAAPEVEDPILSEIWATLKEEQQDVLRYLAELPHPETEERVASCLSDVIHRNRFNKAIKALKSLNLIVVKPVQPQSETVELHPLVRAFIRRRFAKEEQADIVDRIIVFFDRMIGRFRESVDEGPASILENWTAKIELCLENGRPALALVTLHEISDSLRARGYTEEFLRLAELVILAYKVTEDPKELKVYHAVCEEFVSALGESEKYEEADAWLEILSRGVAGKSARYIWLCSVRSHGFWLRGDYKNALRWASEGVDLKTSSQMDTTYDCAHELALARRDAGDVDSALKYFLLGEKLEAVVLVDHFDAKRGGHYYGNIGRCLQYQGRLDDALSCIRKSARLLEKEKAQFSAMNRGWAAQWIGEICQKQDNPDLAFIAFRTAAAEWTTVSPGRARSAQTNAKELEARVQDKTLLSAGDWECKQMYLNWLRRGRL